MISRKRTFQDAESITKYKSIDPDQSKHAIENKRFKDAYYSETKLGKHMVLSVKKICDPVSVKRDEQEPNEEDGNEDCSFVYTRKRSFNVSDEQCSSKKKVKLQELDDEVIDQSQENTNVLTLKKNLDENIVQTSNKPRFLTALLLNGNLSSVPENIDEHNYRIYNTCAFDSLVTIISRAFLDNSSYTNFVDANSNSEFLNFCKAAAFRDSADNLNRQRVKILKKVFDVKTKASNLKVINCECNVMKITYDLLKEYPSAKDRIRCSNDNCKNANRNRNNSTIILDVQKLEDLKNLEEILKEYAKLMVYKCGLCGETILRKRELSHHLFIETDQFERTSKFTLADFPPELSVENYRFVLNGSVNYNNGHYTSHVLRSNQNLWETHNDLKRHIEICTIPEKLIVNPHLMVYTKM